MNRRKALPVGALFMIMAILLATLGVAYGLWFKVLTVEGRIETGLVHAVFLRAFTDDDDFVDDPTKDSLDLDDCQDFGHVDDVGQPINQRKDGLGNGRTSCDPAASGRDPKPRYEKDVARCDAVVDPQDRNAAIVKKINVYPSYFCTAWFDIAIDGTIPVRVASVTVNGRPVHPSVPTPFDLSGDGKPDVAIHITGINTCQQIEPGEIVQMDIDQHILQEAPQGNALEYRVQVQLNQFNEPCLEVDHFANSRALIGIQTPDGDLHNAILNGPTTVHVALAALGDSDGDGLEQVPTEMVELELSGNSDLGPIILRLRDPSKHPMMRSLGEIEENANTQAGRLDLPPFAPSGTAASFFDVFFEVELPALGMKFHNDQPARMQATIRHKPPARDDTYFKPGDPIPLFDEFDRPTGVILVSARHIPNPGALPDLTVRLREGPTKVRCELVDGGVECFATVEFDVINPSTVDVAAAFDVLITADRVPPKSIAVLGGLAAGASQFFSVELGPGGNCYDPDCTVTVTVDSGSAIPESDETNNIASRTDIG